MQWGHSRCSSEGGWCGVRKLAELSVVLPKPCWQQEFGKRERFQPCCPAHGVELCLLPSVPLSTPRREIPSLLPPGSMLQSCVCVPSWPVCPHGWALCGDSLFHAALTPCGSCSSLNAPKPQHWICLQLLDPCPPKSRGWIPCPGLRVCGIGLEVWDQVPLMLSLHLVSSQNNPRTTRCFGSRASRQGPGVPRRNPTPCQMMIKPRYNNNNT